MSIAQAYVAGLQTPGRFSGIGTGLKAVLEQMKQTQQLNSYAMQTGLEQQGALSRALISADYEPTQTPIAKGTTVAPGMPVSMQPNGAMAMLGWRTPGSESLPENMREYYSMYRNKPYRIKAFPGEQIPGYEESMGIGYLKYIDENIPQLADMYRRKGRGDVADLIESRAAGMRDKIATGMLGVNPTEYNNAMSQPPTPSMGQRLLQGGKDFFRNVMNM